jgi:PIN domain nuclease of toxin-antitoxin system
VILLDTHVVLWLAFEPEKVSRVAHKRIKEARSSNEGVAVSGITLLELATAATKGRFRVAMALNEFLDQIESTFLVLPITGRGCARTVALPAEFPGDPADRIIAATALVEDYTLLTADRDILACLPKQTVW